MLLSGTVISISDPCAKGVAISLAACGAVASDIVLTISNELLKGFFPSEWKATFTPGRETKFRLANDGAVIGFQVGNFVRGTM